jgi:formate C-acetyltransferase
MKPIALLFFLTLILSACNEAVPTPKLLKDDSGLTNLVQLVRTYFKLDGHHIQFNVVDAATLRAAKEHPDQHRDLIVRVAGYSDYFCDLGEALQDEIIARTEQMTF